LFPAIVHDSHPNTHPVRRPASKPIHTMTEADADIKQQYLTYIAQLHKVEELLKTDPTDAKSLGVKTKLVEVISLFTQLLGADVAKALSQQAATAASSSSSSSSSSSTTTTADADGPKWPIGSVCEFTSPEGQQFPVCIFALKSAALYRVHFFGFDRQQDVAEDKLSKVPQINSAYLFPSSIQEGLECEAKYYVDGQWYDAKIKNVMTSDEDNSHNSSTGISSVTVDFTLYGNTEHVPVEWLRVKKLVKIINKNANEKDGATSTTHKPKKYQPVSDPKILKVPDHLRAKEGDTDKERKNKRKRMRSIQNKNRFAKKEIESNQKQASWQNFHHKATTSKKFKKGAVSTTSQFSFAKKR
jgi:hypothetical protein